MKGGASVMSSMSHQFAGMMSSVNARTSASAASGDINLGNAQVDNYSYNNTNGNKIDTTGVERIHGNTKQDATGYETTTFDDGKQVISGQNALSRSLPVNISGNDVLSNSLSQSATDSINASKVSGEQVSTSIASVNNAALSQMSGVNTSNSYGSNSATGDSGSHNKGFSDMSSTVKSYAKDFNVSEEQALSDLTTMYIAAEAGVKVGTPGSGIFGSGAHVSANAGTKGSTDESNSSRMSESERASRQESYLDQFSTNVNTVKSYSSGEQASETNSKNAGETQSFLQGINEATTQAKNYQSQLTEAQSYTDAANSVKSGSISVGRDFNQDFVNFVGKAREQEGDFMDVIKGETPQAIETRNQLVEEFANSPEVKAMAEQYKNHEFPQNRDDIVQAQERYASDIDVNKQQSPHYAPAPLNESLYQSGEFERIQGHAAQGNAEIRQDVWKEERDHTPSNVQSIDMEQARADAKAAHALIPQDNRSDDEKMAETVRQSSPFNTGPKMW